MTRRNFDAEFRLRQNARVSPFLGLYCSAGDGAGTTAFVDSGNEFAVSSDFDDSLTSMRGGVKLRFGDWNLTLEQGRTTFSDKQAVFLGEPGQTGNRQSTFLGRQITLDRLDQHYDAEGSGVFNRAVVAAQPLRSLSLSGQFLYSRPKIDVRQQLSADGSFLFTPLLTGFTTQSEQSLSDASRPRSAGSWNTVLRAHKRLRILQSWSTDRYHVTSGASLARVLDTDPERLIETAVGNSLILNYNRSQLEAVFDVSRHFTVRAGHRYEWGNAIAPPGTLRFGDKPPGQGELRRHIGLAGASYRADSRLRVSFDLESSPGDATFFRTGLMDYTKSRTNIRYKVRSDLAVTVSAVTLDNRNLDPAIDLDFEHRQASVSVYWTPASRRFSILADYTRSTTRSDIRAIELPFFANQLLNYRDHGNHGGAYLDFHLPRDVQLTLGGSYSTNDGSRPIRYYQPRIEAAGPLAERFRWKAEWRYYAGARHRCEE